MSESFNILLTSNVRSYSQTNTISKFTTKLPNVLSLDSSWQVAAFNVHYPKTFYSFDKDSMHILVLTDDSDLRAILDPVVIKDVVNLRYRSKRQSSRFGPRSKGSRVNPTGEEDTMQGGENQSAPRQQTVSSQTGVSTPETSAQPSEMENPTVVAQQTPSPSQLAAPEAMNGVSMITPQDSNPPPVTLYNGVPLENTPVSGQSIKPKVGQVRVTNIPIEVLDKTPPTPEAYAELHRRMNQRRIAAENNAAMLAKFNNPRPTQAPVSDESQFKHVFVVPVRGSNGGKIPFSGGDFPDVESFCRACNEHYGKEKTVSQHNELKFDADGEKISMRPEFYRAKTDTLIFPYFTDEIRSAVSIPEYDSDDMINHYKSWKQKMTTRDAFDQISFGPIDLFGGLYNIHMYCNIVQSRILGDTRAQRLRTLPIPHVRFGSPVTCDFKRLEFVDLCIHEFDEIEVSFRFDNGDLVPFQYGRTMVELVFQKKIKA